MGLFNFSKKKKAETEIIDLNKENELNLFHYDIDSDEFIEMVRNLNDINKKFQQGYNLLHFAAEYQSLKLANALFSLGIRVDEKNKYGNTPLWIATFNAKGKYEMVDLLMNMGANPNSVNDARNTPLKFAETIQDEALIMRLVKNKS
ncbi:ankyrin repeat domain-containing protein [bacterium]|nr:ankyrin repeat domain-containing protein [bacterium]